jgi:putative protease
MNKKPELLAPAGDYNSLVAAVQNGADAIYFGGSTFSARGYADNFPANNLEEAIDYAHLYGVRVYVTVNTLIKDSEFSQAIDFLTELCNMGVDAVIVQDVGLLAACRSHLPQLPVHASTQMTVHNTESVKLLEQYGIKRVVLSREMSLEEIDALNDNTDMELEVFVHGALCISYSGQCLMSSMIGGRSGNRGYCAQPCRRQYSLSCDNEIVAAGYLLSPKDLCAARLIPELVAAGVDSFKIEGRMKRPEYVGGVVSIYRKLIDRYFADPTKFHVAESEIRYLEQLFNRGFTSAYLEGSSRDMMGAVSPGNRGIPIGTIVEMGRYMDRAVVFLEEDLAVGDGIVSKAGDGEKIGVIYRAGRQKKSASAGDTIEIPFSGRLEEGDILYRTLDSRQIKQLQQTYTSPAPQRKIPVVMHLEARFGHPLSLSVKDRDYNSISLHSDYVVEAAKGKAASEKQLRKQLAKLGNTAFVPSSISIEMDEGIFVPVGVLNELRTDAVDLLRKKRTEQYHRECSKPSLESVDSSAASNTTPLLCVAVSSVEDAKAAVAAGADVIYFAGLPMPSVDEIAIVKEQCQSYGTSLYLSTPRIIKNGEMKDLFWLLEEARECGGLLVANMGMIGLASDKKIPFVIDSPLNVFNHHSCSFLKNLGARRVTASVELTLDELGQVADGCSSLECIAEGNFEVMVSEYCPLSHTSRCSDSCHKVESVLVDRKGYSFPLKTDEHCRMHLLNSRGLSMLDYLEDVIATGVSAIRIEARWESPGDIGSLVGLYRQVLDGRATTKKMRAGKKYTTGHFYRGVL